MQAEEDELVALPPSVVLTEDGGIFDSSIGRYFDSIMSWCTYVERLEEEKD